MIVYRYCKLTVANQQLQQKPKTNNYDVRYEIEKCQEIYENNAFIFL